MSSTQGAGHGVNYGSGDDAGHGSIHETEHGFGHGSGHETETFLDTWWPLFVILFGFMFFLIVSHWHPSY